MLFKPTQFAIEIRWRPLPSTPGGSHIRYGLCTTCAIRVAAWRERAKSPSSGHGATRSEKCPGLGDHGSKIAQPTVLWKLHPGPKKNVRPAIRRAGTPQAGAATRLSGRVQRDWGLMLNPRLCCVLEMDRLKRTLGYQCRLIESKV